MSDERKVQISDMVDIMTMNGGRKTIHRWLYDLGTFSDTFDSDSHKHAFNAGMRKAGLRILADLKDAAPDKVQLMMKENANG